MYKYHGFYISIIERIETNKYMDLSLEELKRLQQLPITELKREDLIDMEDVVIEPKKSVEGRLLSFMEQAKNPFAQKVGEYIVQVGFMEETDDLIDDRMILLAKRKTQIMV